MSEITEEEIANLRRRAEVADGLSCSAAVPTEQLRALLDLAAEALALRPVADAASEFFAERGKIQPRSKLHDALVGYYRHVARAHEKASPMKSASTATSGAQEETATQLERDVWVSAFGHSAAFGHSDPEYWAAVAVLRLRRAPTGGPAQPTPSFVSLLWHAVEAFGRFEARVAGE